MMNTCVRYEFLELGLCGGDDTKNGCVADYKFCGPLFFFCSLQGLIYAIVKEVYKHFCSACSVILFQRLFIKAHLSGRFDEERSPDKTRLSHIYV